MSRDATGHTTLLALLRVKGVDWHVVAREAQRPHGLDRLVAGTPLEASKEAAETAELLRAAAPQLENHRVEVAEMVDRAAAAGASLVTVLDDEYPANLRTVFNLPPFLFCRGQLREDDARAVAVVGTRSATDEGLQRARQMARLLAEHHVTVLSGLARGIDTAAHLACLDAGGRTIAVLGSGILRVYPPENAELADRITQDGAVVSQFWPDAPPTRYSFPRRNAVMSGMGQGTVVIEASATSGAKMQARLALEHGKKVWLLESLVSRYPWAKKYLERGATDDRVPQNIGVWLLGLVDEQVVAEELTGIGVVLAVNSVTRATARLRSEGRRGAVLPAHGSASRRLSRPRQLVDQAHDGHPAQTTTRAVVLTEW